MSTAIAVAGVAVLSGGVLAATNGHRGGPNDEVFVKVAETLGVDADELGEALAQARTEVAQEKRDARLDQLVEDGVLTQEQVDEIKAWQAERPAALDDLGHAGGRIGPANEDRLAQLVEDGTLTQEEADEILAWHNDRPDALSEVRPNRGRHSGRHQGGGHGPRGQFRGSFEGEFEGQFRGSFGSPFGERFNFEVPGIEGGLELIVPSSDGRSA